MTLTFFRSLRSLPVPTPMVLLALACLLLPLLAGCAQSQMSESADPEMEAGGQGSNDVSQTGQRTDEDGTNMPLGRSVRLIDATEDPVANDARTSRAFKQEMTEASPTSIGNGQPIDQRVDALLAKMTLKQKVGQMTQFELGMVVNKDAFPQPIDPAKLREVIREHQVGSILNVASAAFSVDHWHKIVRAIQEEAAQTDLGIPILYGIDAVHGANYTQEAILFPQSQGLSATWNLALAKEAGEITARDVRASGISWNFAPVIDVGRDLRWPRLYESPSEDPYLTGAMGLAAVDGMQGNSMADPDHVAACLKHFIGYSGSDSGRDRTPALIPENELRATYLPPFKAAVDAGAASVMVNSGEVNGVPVHSSKELLTGMLREELGFDGLIVTDWLDIKKLVSLHQVAADEREATRMAVEAGIDMSMVPSDPSFIGHLVDLVESGEITEERVDASVRRILRLKMKLGLFDDPMRGMRDASEIGTNRDRKVALQAARESVTLLKNADGVLPLNGSERVLVTGPTAHSMQSLNNGWTYTWQGGGRAQDMFHEGRPTLMEAIRAKVGDGQMEYVPGATLIRPDRMAEAVEAAQNVDVAVVAVGEGAYAETAGNIRDLALPASQRTLIQRISATGTPVVLVLLQGRPRTLGDTHESVSAILTAYNPGPEGGQAVMDVLYGEVNPSGHLPYTYPATSTGFALYDYKPSERLAADFGMEGAAPLFAFGHGLSYTTFDYENLQVSPARVSTNDVQSGATIDVTVTVTNSGNRRGKDVVQLFVSDLVASVTPAARRLKQFAKVDLAPGQSETVTFTLAQDDLSFIGRDHTPIIEAGEFEIHVEDLTESLTLSGSTVSLSTAAE